MKRNITRIATGAAMMVIASFIITTSAAESETDIESKAEEWETVTVDFSYLEDYEPQVFYALDGAEIFETADRERISGTLRAGTKINCYQKTDNGFYYGTTDGSQTFYIHEEAVGKSRNSRKKAHCLVPDWEPDSQPKEDDILFICSSFGELEQVTIENLQENKRVILRGMGMYDYESYDFVSEDTQQLRLIKEYLDGEVIDQLFWVADARQQVGIYDDGSFDKSWLELDGAFLYEEEYIGG